jgi:hypothetical protein
MVLSNVWVILPTFIYKNQQNRIAYGGDHSLLWKIWHGICVCLCMNTNYGTSSQLLRDFESLRWWTKMDKKAGKHDLEPDLSSFKTSKARETVTGVPNWDDIPSKGVEMSEEEFEKAISALALKAAEKGMAIGDAKKGFDTFRNEEIDLLTKYLSTVSPDRKTAYESGKKYGSNVIYGEYKQELMTYSGGSWNAKLTNAELSRASKFYDIYQNAIKKYEAEHGQIPQAQKKAASTSAVQYQMLAESVGSRSYSLLNYLA